MVKLAKYKDNENSKTAGDKRSLNYMGSHISLTADLSTETWQSRKEWHDIFNVLNGKNIQPRILYPARLIYSE